ncbi:MAG: Type IV pilus assembly protein PilM [Parcubacteria group bacterium GW2011_GWD2_38_11]|nr:MAG: Type IV pilus assembly protein PilM [Parcubacteria group bacterium GW2011_GWD2_38_11]
MSFLNKKIFNNDFDVFGLDLSDLSVKVIRLEDDGTSEYVASYSTVMLASGAISDGEIQQKDQVVTAIKKAVEAAGPEKIKTKKVICSLPETKAFLRIVSIPQMSDDELNEAVKWEMEANIPLPLDQVYYDWQLIPETLLLEKNRINLLVVAIAKAVVDQTIEVLELAGLEPVGLEIESIAQARSLLLEKNEKETVLIVDIGDRRTSFSVTKGGLPCFTSSIPLCGQSLTDVISKGMNIGFEEAEKIKISYGIGDDFKNDALFKATQPVLENFAQEIERSIDFFITGLKYSNSIDKIIICGGGANTKGILPYFSKKLGREIQLGNPWINMKLGKNLPVIEKNQSLQFSTAAGLALKGLHYEDLS